jgi:hypothetical protein
VPRSSVRRRRSWRLRGAVPCRPVVASVRAGTGTHPSHRRSPLARRSTAT